MPKLTIQLFEEYHAAEAERQRHAKSARASEAVAKQKKAELESALRASDKTKATRGPFTIMIETKLGSVKWKDALINLATAKQLAKIQSNVSDVEKVTITRQAA